MVPPLSSWCHHHDFNNPPITVVSRMTGIMSTLCSISLCYIWWKMIHRPLRLVMTVTMVKGAQNLVGLVKSQVVFLIGQGMIQSLWLIHWLEQHGRQFHWCMTCVVHFTSKPHIMTMKNGCPNTKNLSKPKPINLNSWRFKLKKKLKEPHQDSTTRCLQTTSPQTTTIDCKWRCQLVPSPIRKQYCLGGIVVLSNPTLVLAV